MILTKPPNHQNVQKYLKITDEKLHLNLKVSKLGNLDRKEKVGILDKVAFEKRAKVYHSSKIIWETKNSSDIMCIMGHLHNGLGKVRECVMFDDLF